MAQKQTKGKTTSTATRSGQQREKSRGASVPVLVPEVHVRHLPVPRVGVGHVPVPKVSLPIPDQVRSHLPDPVDNRVLWYGGLAGLAAVGVIGWPVAGVVAAGSYVAEHRARHWLADHEDGGRGDRGTGQARKTARATTGSRAR